MNTNLNPTSKNTMVNRPAFELFALSLGPGEEAREAGYAFDDLYRGPLMRCAGGVLGAKSAYCNDVVQEVFTDAVEHSDRVPADEEHLRARLLRITKSIALDYQHRRSKMVPLPPRVPIDGPGAATQIREADYRAHVRAAVEKLPEPLRTLILRRYFDNFTFKEIARELVESTRMVRKRHDEALDTLKRVFGADMEGNVEIG